MLTKEQFRELVLEDQERRREREKRRQTQWTSYQAEKGGRIRSGAFAAARGPEALRGGGR